MVAHNLCSDPSTWQTVNVSFSAIALVITIIIALIGHTQFRKAEKIAFVFKYIFYICTISAIIELSRILVKIILCYFLDITSLNQSMFLALSSSYMIYGFMISHVFFLWLLRLHYTFKGSVHEKSNRFFIAMTAAFVMMVISASIGFLLFIHSMRYIGICFIIFAAFGYVFVSVALLFVFVRSLFKLITNKVVTIRFKTKATLQRKTENIIINANDQKIIEYITKYFILGTASFLSTLVVCIIGAIYLFGVIGESYAQIFKLAVIVDVLNNILCIYLQFNYAHSTYWKVCGCCFKAVNSGIEKKASAALSINTYTFYAKRFSGSPTIDSSDDALLDDL